MYYDSIPWPGARAPRGRPAAAAAGGRILGPTAKLDKRVKLGILCRTRTGTVGFRCGHDKGMSMVILFTKRDAKRPFGVHSKVGQTSKVEHSV